MLVKSQVPSFQWAGSINAWHCTGVAGGGVYVAGSFTGINDVDPGPSTHTLTASGTDAHVTKLDASGTFVWTAQMGGGSSIVTVRGICTDVSGNIYITGGFRETPDFDPGPAVFTVSAVGFNQDAFVAKLSSSGALLWVKTFSSPNDVYGWKITTDNNGNVYSSGYFDAVVDFDPGPATYTLNSDNGDNFLLKLNAAGNFDWAQNISGRTEDIKIGANNDLHVIGEFLGTFTFNSFTGSITMTSQDAQYDGFLLRLSSAGGLIWGRQIGGGSDQYGHSLDINGGDEIYVCGSFEDTLSFYPASQGYSLVAQNNPNTYIAKYSPVGNILWYKKLSSTNGVMPQKILCDVSGAYIMGDFIFSVDCDPGPGASTLISAGSNDMFFMKLDFTGNFAWAARVGASSNDMSSGMALDGANGLYISGLITGTVDVDCGPGTYTLSSNPQKFFLTKIGTVVGLEEKQEVSSNFTMWPNPVKESLSVEAGSDYDIQIFNLFGVMVYEIHCNGIQSIPVNNLEKGIYLVRFTKDHIALGTKKLIKE